MTEGKRQDSLLTYIKKFQNLNILSVGGLQAPHKPVLLLTILTLVKEGKIHDEVVPISDYVIHAFLSEWEKYVQASKFKPVFNLAFSQMQSEDFWEITCKKNYKKENYTLQQLRTFTNGARIDKELLEQMADPNSNRLLRQALLKTYFPDCENAVQEIAELEKPIEVPGLYVIAAPNEKYESEDVQDHVDKEKGQDPEEESDLEFSNKEIKCSEANNVSFFDELLESRGLIHCPLPLWKLKLTKAEYEKLRRLLAEEDKKEKGFKNSKLNREICLFYAEYWRREFTKSKNEENSESAHHTKKMVYDAIVENGGSGRQAKDFFEAAKEGAEVLKIEKYQGQCLNSMLYQGGLPMKMIVTPDTKTSWDAFIRGLVFRNVNFDLLTLGKIAKQLKGIREFCDVLSDAVNSKAPQHMPFYCEGENDPYYAFLVNRFQDIHRERKALQPFSLRWDFHLRPIEGNFVVTFSIDGPQTLSKSFRDDHKLPKKGEILAYVECNGLVIDTFKYTNGFSRYKVESSRSYTDGDVISLRFEGEDNPLLCETLDMSEPHLLFSIGAGHYSIGNRIGKQKSEILLPEGWRPIQEGDTSQYLWEGKSFIGLQILEDREGEVEITNDREIISYNSKTVPYWTEVISTVPKNRKFKEQVFDLNKAKVFLCHEEDGVAKKELCECPLYKNKGSHEWTEKPCFGSIQVKARSSSSDYVVPLKIINIGPSLKVHKAFSEEETCRIRIEWPNGKIAIAPSKRSEQSQGRLVEENTWLINRSDCDNPRRIPIVFTPTENPENAFTLNIEAPFTELSLLDAQENKVEEGITVPLKDLEAYSYRCLGLDRVQFSIGRLRYDLDRNDKGLAIKYQGSILRIVPDEGSLMALLGTTETIERELQFSSENVLNAEVILRLSDGKSKCVALKVKDFPYRIEQNDKKLFIRDGEKIVDFRKHLLAFQIDNPKEEPIIIKYEEGIGFQIPEEIGEVPLLVTGQRGGRILPKLIVKNQDIDDETIIL